jgi:hypothetical protein
VVLRVHVTGPGGWSKLLLSYDWSLNGVFLRTRAQLPVGTKLELAVVFRKPVGRLVIRGHVVRTMSLVKVGDRQGIIVAFDQVPPDFARFLEDTTRVATKPPSRSASAK